jgi:O-antigen/teichoic acid export membrane protein
VADRAVAALPAGAAAAHARAPASPAARFLSTSVLLLGARLGGAAAGFLVQLVLARMLSAQALGVYFAVSSLVVVAGVAAAHGYPSLATRYVSRYRQPHRAGFLAAFVAKAQAESLALALALAVAVAAAGMFWPNHAVALAIAALGIPFVTAFRFYGSLATATRRFVLAYIPDVSLKPAAILLALGLLVATDQDVTLVAALLATTAATAVLSVTQLVILARCFPVELRPGRRRTPRRLATHWRREAHATLFVAVFSQFLADIAILAAAPFLASADTAAFGVCIKLAFLVGFFVALTQNIAAPDIADAIGRNGEGGPAMRIAAAAKAATVGTAAATIAAALFGAEALGVFGPEFAAAWPALTILVATQFVRAAFGPVNAVLTIAGKRRANLLATAAGAAVLLIGMATLASALGATGAALSVLLAALVWAGGSALALSRTTGLRVDVLAAVAPRSRS